MAKKMADGDELIAPGFRFDPTEEELISFYLELKLQRKKVDQLDRVIPVLYIYDFNPWELPQLSGEVCRADPQLEEWFFFIPRQEKEARGGRPNRLTTSGYWKATGSPTFVYSSDGRRTIGVKRTMVFYHGRSRTSSDRVKTKWKMNEYVAIDPVDHPASLASSSRTPIPSHKGQFTLCRVYTKSKCFRAFDRRPAAALPADGTTLVQQAKHDQPTCSTSTNEPLASTMTTTTTTTVVERSISSSSSGEEANEMTGPSQATTNNDEQEGFMDMQSWTDGAPLWEWDTLMDSWNIIRGRYET